MATSRFLHVFEIGKADMNERKNFRKASGKLEEIVWKVAGPVSPRSDNEI